MLIHYEKETENKAKVMVIRYVYDESDKQLDNTLEVEAIPDAEELPFKTGLLYVNPITKVLWYEYDDRPLSPEEKTVEEIEQLKADNEMLKLMVAELGLIVGGGL